MEINSINDAEQSYITTQTEREEFLGKLSDNILITNIKEQLIKNEGLFEESPNNLLEVFDDRYFYIVNLYSDDEIMINNCNLIKENLYKEILNTLINKYQFSTEIFDTEISDDNFYYYIRGLYEFFILDYYKNIVKFFSNYIINNKKELINLYKENLSKYKKDLSFKYYSKLMNSNEKAILLYNIEDIIKDYISLENNYDEFIKDIINLENYNINMSIMNDLFVENKYESYLSNEFLINFFNNIFDENKQINYVIITKIRNSIIEQLRNN